MVLGMLRRDEGPKTKFLPLKEMSYNIKEKTDADKFKVVNKVDQLNWYVHPDSKNHVENSSSILGSIKPSMESRVETQTMYFMDVVSGRSGFIQVVNSSMMKGVYKGFQLNFKVFHSKKTGDKDADEVDVWESFKLENLIDFQPHKLEFKGVKFEFTKTNKKDKKHNFFSQLHIKIETSHHGSNIKSLKINLTVDLCEGYMVNPDGCSYYLDKAKSSVQLNKEANTASTKMLRHLYIPRGRCNGEIKYTRSDSDKESHFTLKNVPITYIDALQGLLPNKAAKAWNFMCFQSRSYSLLCMEYTTPEEYGNSTVTTWSVTKDEKLMELHTSVSKDNVKFSKTLHDDKTGWDYPTAIDFPMNFKEKKLNLVNTYDVMEELPAIVKKLAQNIAHVKPFIYQYCQSSKYSGEEGVSIIESTFIS